jgi:hypothetical protein
MKTTRKHTSQSRRRAWLGVPAMTAAAAAMSVAAPAVASGSEHQVVGPQPQTEEERRQFESGREYEAQRQREAQRQAQRAQQEQEQEHHGPRREGGQIEFFAGATACIPGEAECSVDAAGIDGFTLPSFGMGVNLGWRANRYVMVGGAYRFGMFHPDFDVVGGSDYRFAYQNSVYAVVRPILPLGRVDIGVDLGPGWSRQVFQRDGDRRDYSQGFSFVIGPTIDVFLTDRFFIGAKVDFLLNAHGEVCSEAGDRTVCTSAGNRDVAPVHQVIYGIHLGGTFGGFGRR